MPLRALNQDGRGDMTNVVKAIDWAVNHGAKVVNLSLGAKTDVASLDAEIAYAVSQNVVFVVSAGNSGDTNVSYPAAKAATGGWANGLLGAGSVSTLKLDQKSDFTAYGTGLEMLAPGENIYTAVPGGQLGAWSGTSFAAPMVSGALALAMGQKLSPSVDSTSLGELVVSSSDKVDAANPQFAGLDYFGSGRLNIESFLKKTLAP
jgi:hypothetical protein